jgi:ATP-dependent DNA helicase DinG
MNGKDVPSVEFMLEVLHRFVQEEMGGSARPGQDQMAVAVYHAIQNKDKHVFDAPTGSGKSLALMVPALVLGERTVVSTGTKALQDQYLRDAPKLCAFLEKRYKISRSVATMKGRSAYVCEEALLDPGLGIDPADLELVNVWLAGDDRGEWDSGPRLPASTRSALSVTSDSCLGSACDQAGSCYALKARERASNADLIIVNHALIGLNVATRGRILPAHEAVMLDEAHTADAFIANALGAEVRFGVSASGVERGSIMSTVAAARRILAEDDSMVDRLSATSPKLRARLTERGQLVKDGRIADPSFPGGIAAVDDDLWVLICEVVHAAGELATRLLTLPIPQNDAKSKKKRDNAARQASNLAEKLERMGYTDPGQTVFLEPDGDTVVLKMVDVRIAGELDDNAWHYESGGDDDGFGDSDVLARGSVMCSGTIPPGFHREMGMSDATMHLVASPFDFGAMRLYVPAHLTAPSGKGGNAQRHQVEAMTEGMVLIDAALATGRGVLVLTTSTESSKVWAQQCRNRFSVKVINPTRAEEKNEAVAEAMGLPQFVVCASQGWYEGVDLPGKLALVIIDKAPMAPPNDPILNAKSALAGRDAFALVTVAHVAAKLGQAAGRLMRRDGDGGIVAVLDSRMRNAGWAGNSRARTGLWAKLPPCADVSVLADAVSFLKARSESVAA